MTRVYRSLAILMVAALSCGCITFVSTSNGPVIDVKKARVFSDAYLDDVVKDNQDAMYSKMEDEFHKITSREKFTELIHSVDEQFGRLTDYEFVGDEVGVKMLYNATTKPTRKMVYRVTTTKGTYTLGVTIVPKGSELAVTDFMFKVE
jgi:hypothetical protein